MRGFPLWFGAAVFLLGAIMAAGIGRLPLPTTLGSPLDADASASDESSAAAMAASGPAGQYLLSDEEAPKGWRLHGATQVTDDREGFQSGERRNFTYKVHSLLAPDSVRVLTATALVFSSDADAIESFADSLDRVSGEPRTEQPKWGDECYAWSDKAREQSAMIRHADVVWIIEVHWERSWSGWADAMDYFAMHQLEKRA